MFSASNSHRMIQAILTFVCVFSVCNSLSNLSTTLETLIAPERNLEESGSSSSPVTSKLAKSIHDSITNNLILKNIIGKRMLKKLAFDANRAKWILANEIEIDDSKRNELLTIFSQLKQKLVKHAVYADFEYPEISF